jgi:eukaryotic-like serine/threonine-protein kinase
VVGSTLGHYRIVRALGRGGMGEVYAAEDTKLNRLIALKVLPPATAGDPDRLARFQREAQAIAALNHPHVVIIHSVEEAQGAHFLTMELVDGPTLAALIPPNGFPLRQLLTIAVPLADAISAAHAQGVVHRDLKPSNVMLGAGARVKVLDFGLAKLREEALRPLDAAGATTARLTTVNQVFGTPAYMSPEQAEGRPVDHRTDIFSLGVLLYELATGTRPFQGATAVSVISSILKDTPAPVLEARPDLPPDLDRIIRRCLAKDPERRYQTALDVRNDLEDLQQQTTVGETAPPPRALRERRPRAQALVLLAGVAIVALLAVGLSRWLARSPSADGTSIAHTVFTQLTSQPAAELFPSVSPDGRWVVYAGEGAGNRDIYLQSTTGQTAINLTEDSPGDDEQPAFSPDGDHIAFRSSRDGGGIFVMGRTGEAVRRLTRGGFNPAWSPDGNHVAFTTGRMELRPQNSEGRSELWIVDADGSYPRKIYDGDATLPNWSPTGTRIAFSQRLGVDRSIAVYTIALAGGDPVLAHGRESIAWNPIWSPDGRYLFYSSDRGGSMNLWRLPIDETSGQTRGEPEPITTPASFAAHLSISADGRRLAYSSVQETQNIQKLALDPVTFEPTADPVNVTTGTRRWSSPDPSPDGTWVAFYSQIQPEGDLYLIRSDGTGLRQVTSGAPIDRVPRWSPDGEWLSWFSDRTGSLQVWKMRTDGSDLQQLTDDEDAGVSVWSPDGKRLAHSISSGGHTHGAIIDAAKNISEQTPLHLPVIDAAKAFVPNSWSPDGTRIVGQLGFANSGIAVYSIPTGAFDHIADFGEWPVWLPDGRHVLVVSRGREFHVIDSRTKTSRRIYAVGRDTLGPPRLTRDGQTAFFSRRVTDADIWLATLQ